MELDHDTGHIEGRCLRGKFAGRALSSWNHDEQLQLLEELRATDPPLVVTSSKDGKDSVLVSKNFRSPSSPETLPKSWPGLKSIALGVGVVIPSG
jgi:hypothetical protein